MSPRILVVDDEKAICRMLEHSLTTEGFEVHVAHDGATFKEKAFAIRPDLIVLDIVLGVDNGVETYNQLIQEGFPENTPTIFLSGLAKDHDSAELGGNRPYLMRSKPFVPSRLIRDIRMLLDQKKDKEQ